MAAERPEPGQSGVRMVAEPTPALEAPGDGCHGRTGAWSVVRIKWLLERQANLCRHNGGYLHADCNCDLWRAYAGATNRSHCHAGTVTDYKRKGGSFTHYLRYQFTVVQYLESGEL